MPDPVMLIEVFKTLSKVAATSSKKEKESLLKKGDSLYLRILLKAAYNKYVTYRIQKIEQPTEFNIVQPDTTKAFLTLCAELASHTLGSNEARLKIKKFLATNTEEGAKVFTNILLRDLRAGFDEKTCNKVFSGLIPVFNVQLANKAEDLEALSYPLVVEEKLDGVRTIAICDGETVKFFSREGREFDECGVIASQLLTLSPGASFVLDGEFIATKFNPENKTCSKYADGNWPFNYGLSLVKSQDKTAGEVRNHLGYKVWDCIDYTYFTTNGVNGHNETLSDRKIRLSSLFARLEKPLNNVEIVPNFVCSDRQQILSIFKQMRLENKEGVMIKKLDAPYEFKRSNAVLKLKEFFNVDLRVIGAEEGKGKYEGLLGALIVSDDDGKITTKVGSGFTDDERADLWVEWLAGRLKGSIIEFSAQEVTKDGSLRFPTFVATRFDKTTTNTEGIV